MPGNHQRHITLRGTRLDDALHRCIVLASPYGTIRLFKPANARTRQFLLYVNDSGADRWRWILTSVASGTDLSITRHLSVPWLPRRAQRSAGSGPELARALDLLPRALNLKIAVVGGGTGLYTTLRGLHDRTWNLTAIISGLRPETARDPKDELGSLPRDDASLCLVALAPASDETMTLRGLLEHRMSEGHWRGTHFGPVLLEALAEIEGSMQAGLDAGTKLLGVHGRIVVANDSVQPPEDTAPSAVEAITQADMVIVAPGHLEADILPVLARPRILDAVRATHGLKVVVTKIMTAEGDPTDEPTTSHQLRSLSSRVELSFDVVVANSASFTRKQLQAYAAVGARPVRPDPEQTSAYATMVVTEQLVAPGHLARHDPKQLGETLIEVGTRSVLATSRSQVDSVAGYTPDITSGLPVQP
jgi:2-phospho-L-lactate transferase/gluconeogenesis factor (CofD/UPF0052 family)